MLHEMFFPSTFFFFIFRFLFTSIRAFLSKIYSVLECFKIFSFLSFDLNLFIKLSKISAFNTFLRKFHKSCFKKFGCFKKFDIKLCYSVPRDTLIWLIKNVKFHWKDKRFSTHSNPFSEKFTQANFFDLLFCLTGIPPELFASSFVLEDRA